MILNVNNFTQFLIKVRKGDTLIHSVNYFITGIKMVKNKEHVSRQLAFMIDSEPTKYMHQSFEIPTPIGQENRGA